MTSLPPYRINPLLGTGAPDYLFVPGEELWEALLELQDTAVVRVSAEHDRQQRRQASEAFQVLAAGADHAAVQRALAELSGIIGSLTGRHVIEDGAEPGWWQSRDNALGALDLLRDLTD